MSNGNITWSQGDRLEWSDFEGSPDQEGYDAWTETRLDLGTREYESQQRSDGTWEVSLDSVEVDAEFDRDGSWVRSEERSDQLLRHEQGHFDLAEVGARTAARDMMEQDLTGTGASETAAKADLHEKMDEVVERVWDEVGELDDAYDTETERGTNAEEQAEWDSRIDTGLSNGELDDVEADRPEADDESREEDAGADAGEAVEAAPDPDEPAETEAVGPGGPDPDEPDAGHDPGGLDRSDGADPDEPGAPQSGVGLESEGEEADLLEDLDLEDPFGGDDPDDATDDMEDGSPGTAEEELD